MDPSMSSVGRGLFGAVVSDPVIHVRCDPNDTGVMPLILLLLIQVSGTPNKLKYSVLQLFWKTLSPPTFFLS